MSFATVMAALSPSVWWRQAESSGSTMTDSSGNARHGTYPNAPTFSQTGLLHDGDTNTANVYSTGATTYGQINNAAWMNVTTFSAFARIKPTGITGTQTILNRFGATGSNNDSFALRMDNAAMRLYMNNAAGLYPSVTLGTLVAGTEYSIGFTYSAGTSRVFLDGVFIGTLSSTAKVVTAAMNVGRSAYGEPFGGTIDEVAFWSGVAVADADHLALHTAAVTPPSITVAGERFTSAATMLDGAALVGVTVSGDAFASSATFLDGSASSGPVLVSGDVFTVATTMLDGTAQTQVLVAGDAFGSSATFLDGLVAGAPIPGEAFSVAAVFLDGGMVVTSDTDTSNFYNGRRRGGLATVELDVPVATPPVASTVVRVDKAIALPQPVLVKGRPT